MAVLGPFASLKAAARDVLHWKKVYLLVTLTGVVPMIIGSLVTSFSNQSGLQFALLLLFMIMSMVLTYLSLRQLAGGDKLRYKDAYYVGSRAFVRYFLTGVSLLIYSLMAPTVATIRFFTWAWRRLARVVRFPRGGRIALQVLLVIAGALACAFVLLMNLIVWALTSPSTAAIADAIPVVYVFMLLLVISLVFVWLRYGMSLIVVVAGNYGPIDAINATRDLIKVQRKSFWGREAFLSAAVFVYGMLVYLVVLILGLVVHNPPAMSYLFWFAILLIVLPVSIAYQVRLFRLMTNRAAAMSPTDR